MFYFNIFLQTFCLVFFVVIAVGPGFITIANTSVNYGYKAGISAVLGAWTVDICYITIGAMAIQTILNLIPKTVLSYSSIIAILFLIYLSYDLWKTDLKKISAKKISKSYWKNYVKLLCLGFSSPIAIIGYGVIFSTTSSGNEFLFSKLLGGYLAALIGHLIVVIAFATIGKKINNKMLIFLNNISAFLLAFFAFTLLFNFIKSLIS